MCSRMSWPVETSYLRTLQMFHQYTYMYLPRRSIDDSDVPAKKADLGMDRHRRKLREKHPSRGEWGAHPRNPRRRDTTTVQGGVHAMARMIDGCADRRTLLGARSSPRDRVITYK